MAVFKSQKSIGFFLAAVLMTGFVVFTVAQWNAWPVGIQFFPFERSANAFGIPEVYAGEIRAAGDEIVTDVSDHRTKILAEPGAFDYYEGDTICIRFRVWWSEPPPEPTPVCLWPVEGTFPPDATFNPHSGCVCAEDTAAVWVCWIPGYCDAGEYTWAYYYAAINCYEPGDIIEAPITVYNVNRCPSIQANPPGPLTVPVGECAHIDVTGSDPDMTECGDDNVALSAWNAPFGATFVDNGGGDGDFNWCPTEHDAGSTYSITFVALDYSECMNTVTVEITVPSTVEANFSGSPTYGCPPLTVQFSDYSIGEIVQWQWSFGDGKTSTLQNPSNIYTGTGHFTVSLTVTGPGGSDTETKENYIFVEPCKCFPPAGNDISTTTADVILMIEGIGTTVLSVSGPINIQRGDPYDPGDGMYRVDAEIVNLELTGSDDLFGEVVIRQNPDTPSPGYVQALQHHSIEDYPATAHIDVMVEIEISDWFELPLYNQDPFPMESTIDCLPFETTYSFIIPIMEIPIYDSKGQWIGYIPQVSHDVPPPQIGCIGLRGDPTGDGVINVLDVLAVANHILGVSILTGDAFCRGDCNGDGVINIIDALLIANVILGIIDRCPGPGGACKPVVTPEVMELLNSLEIYLSTEDFAGLMTQAKEVAGIPTGYHLSQNYPNPFNPVTTIEYSIGGNVHTRLEVYNILGQKVVTLVDEVKEIGQHSVNWEAGNLASGIYILRLEAGSFMSTKRMVFIR